MKTARTYLDWNATAPLRPEARDAMLSAMDEVGNPSSVHAEGRRAKAIVERARAQVADLVGCDASQVVFTSGATEAIDIVGRQPWDDAICSPLEHDAVAARFSPLNTCPYAGASLVDEAGGFLPNRLPSGFGVSKRHEGKPVSQNGRNERGVFALTAANAETGVLQPVDEACADYLGELPISHRFCDATQAVGKTRFSFRSTPIEYAACSSHKFGGPKGAGALIVKSGVDLLHASSGGGQESGRRAGTEDVIGIAGFGAAAEAAKRDLEAGVWDRVAKLRNILEETLEDAAPDLLIIGRGASRLPNTSCLAIPGWKGETQVMQMDLAGFAISAGSACSSGKVNKASRVLLAMGFDETTASSAVRVSIGPTTTEAEVNAFATAWIAAYQRWKAKAA